MPIRLKACMPKLDQEFIIRALENYGSILDEMKDKGVTGGGTSIVPFVVDDEIKKNNKMFDYINNFATC